MAGTISFGLQFIPSTIILQGYQFSSAEKALQFFKAKCHSEFKLARAILASEDGIEIESIINECNVQQGKWDIVEPYIIYRIEYEKVTNLKI